MGSGTRFDNFGRTIVFAVPFATAGGRAKARPVGFSREAD